jgi:hypothetical protein
MDHLSYEVGKICFGTSSRSAGDSMFSSALSAAPVRNLCQTLLVVSIAFLSSSFAQLPVLTSRADIRRTGANTNETSREGTSSFRRTPTLEWAITVVLA